MKKLTFLFLLLPTLSFAFDASLKGFIALDVIDMQKIEGKKITDQVGIGVLDLKVFAEQDNMTAAMKLDLDGKLTDDYNIFEEAYATYRGVPNFRFSVGKGVVKYQNLHWGSVQNTYLDGGTILGTENSWRKLARKAYASASYGGKSLGFINTFWLWGDSVETNFDEKGNPKYATPTYVKAYQTSGVKAFNTNLQVGLANKFELMSYGNWTFTNGLVYYKKKLQDNASWSVDLGAVYETADLEFWVDLLVGHSQKPKFDSYAYYSGDEAFFQVGIDKSLDEKWSWVSNAEAVYTINQNWNYATFTQDGTSYTVDKSLLDKSGLTVKSFSYKLETSLKYKLSKTSFITSGVLFEQKTAIKNGIKDLSYIPGVFNANRSAYEAISSISFWF